MSESYWSAGLPLTFPLAIDGAGQESYWWRGLPYSGRPTEDLSGYVAPVVAAKWWQGLPFTGMSTGLDFGTEALWQRGLPGIPLLGVTRTPVLTASADYLFEG